ncbi:MAG TPA: DUF3391 domain-containing protein [Burkholderiales bacterium]|jgi:putative nucleotidyltransferase with HDIG domain|nr:DUF3391 domain-containing protein [Burkholderiales bacterium]
MQARASIDQLKVGVYIHLDLGWMDHPFGFSSFKIKSVEQISTLRELGLTSVRIDPDKSDTAVNPVLPSPAPAAAAAAPGTPEQIAPSPALQAKLDRQQKLAQRREAIARVERRYQKTAESLRRLQNSLKKAPAQSVADVALLAQALSSDLLAQPEISLFALQTQSPNQEPHVHALNVALLSLVVAREMKISGEEGALLVQGAFYHDVGLREVPSRILLKTESLSSSERAAREEHVESGIRLARELALPMPVLEIVAHHHVLMDGSGYPSAMQPSKLSPLARIVALVNQYDNLCNNVDLARSLTPHEALSLLFKQQRQKFDEQALQILIRCLGVYPPGTLVQLSNDSVCLVSSVNTARPLRPTVVAYDAKTPRESPMVVDLLEEKEISIRTALRRSQVPAAALDYLTGRGRVSYFYERAEA